MIKLEILNLGLRLLEGNEFKAYYYIANSMGRINRWKRLNHSVLAEAIGVSSKTAQRLTSSLHDKGFIRKETKYSKLDGKRHTAFLLNLDVDDIKVEEFEDIDVPINDKSDDTGDVKIIKLRTPVSQLKECKKQKEIKNIQISKKAKDIELFEQEMLNS